LIAGSSIGNNSGNYKCLIHIDRLSITFKHWSGSTFLDVRNPDHISSEQLYNNITLIHDPTPGIGAFYHTFKVFYKGYVVGKLHTATKLKKHELQFDFAKEVFYAFYSGYWHEVYLALMSELRIIYNNIKYVEISVDTDKNLVEQFGFLFYNAENNLLASGNRYKLKNGTMVHVMNNGSSFVVAGTDNEIAIYNKSKYAEDFILDYFKNNGLNGKHVYRIESRLRWNYIRYLRNMKLLDIDVEVLLDPRKLAKIFQVSTSNKITFQDKTMKTYNESRNPHYLKLSVMDDLSLQTAEIGKINAIPRINHYITESVDENILRQIYYRFLETNNNNYLQNLKASGKVAGFDNNQIICLVMKFNSRYKGNQTIQVKERMEHTLNALIRKSPVKFNGLFYAILLKFKWNLLGIFSG
jgi:hypothetical protein